MAKKPRGPTLPGIVFLGVLSVLAGGLLAAWLLVTQGVEVVTEMPPEDKIDRGAAYVLRGPDRGSAPTWTVTRDAILAGEPGPVVLTELEANLWALRESKPASASARPPARGQKEQPAPKVEKMTRTEPLNLLFDQNKVQFLTTVVFPFIGSKRPVVMAASMRFVQQREGPPRVEFHSMRFGRLPLPAVLHTQPAVQRIWVRLFEDSADFEPLAASWQKVQRIDLDGKDLTVTFR